MSLRNRFANFFNKPKSEASATQEPSVDQEQPVDPSAVSAEQPAGAEGAVTWDSLAAERKDDAKPEITYDDLARLVRFPGSAPAETPELAAAQESAPAGDLEIVNGGGVVI